MTDTEMLDEKDKEGLIVLFKPLPDLPATLKQHQHFLKLYTRLNAIDAQIKNAASKRAKLRVVTQTSAVHLTCLRQAKRIAMEQESSDSVNSRTWLKAIVVIAERAKELMARENVKEHFSHYEKPKILRVLVVAGNHYRAVLREKMGMFGIMAKDEVDIRFTLDHWELILGELTLEPQEEVMRLEFCKQTITWLESLLAVALAYGAPNL